jgi:hypothetical protein
MESMPSWDQWPEKISSARQTGQLLEYVMKKTDRRVMLIIAIGANSVAIAKDQKLDPKAAVAVLEDVRETVERLIQKVHEEFPATRQEYGSELRSGPR